MLYTNVQCHRVCVGSCSIRLIFRFKRVSSPPFSTRTGSFVKPHECLSFFEIGNDSEFTRSKNWDGHTEVSRYCIDTPARVLSLPADNTFQFFIFFKPGNRKSSLTILPTVVFYFIEILATIEAL